MATTSATDPEARGPVIVLVGNDGDDDKAVERAISIASEEDRALVIVDRGGVEGMLGNAFYEDLRSEDDFKPEPDQAFHAGIARREGRNELAGYIERATSAGLSAGGWFPSESGLDAVREAIERFGGSVLVVPGSLDDPGLGDRFQGVTMENLEQLGARLETA